LGEDQLSLIVHPSSPLKALSISQLQAIYNGSAQKWNVLLQPACKECAPDSAKNPLSGKEIHPWAYLPGEDIQKIFQTQAGLAARTGLNFLAPNPTAMRTAIASDPQAIGFLPQRDLDASVKSLQLTGIKVDTLRQPVTASLPAKPQPETQVWLACVTEKLK
jgi:ABC-type phosphate transport system substrate-binding protein